jgi:geranylgeranyl pyrophosphate synthase
MNNIIYIIIFVILCIFIYNKYNLCNKKEKYISTTDISLLNYNKIIIESYIKENIEKHITNTNLREIIMYSLGKNSKRIRPIIILSLYKHLNNTNNYPDYIIEMALCIEYIHCASLIIDDIMDNDEMRRESESVYKKYDLTTAQFASVILCSLALKNFYKSLDNLNNNKDNINKNIYILLGNVISNMLTELCLGQYLDVNKLIKPSNIGENIKNTVEQKQYDISIENLIHQKTSSLFEFCFIIPWLFTNYEKQDKEIKIGIEKMTEIGKQFGLIFQITDDFEDIENDIKKNGKNTVMNYPINKGCDLAYAEYNNILMKLNHSLQKNNILSPELVQSLTFLKEKTDYYYNKN